MNGKRTERFDIFCFPDISYPTHVIERIHQIYKTCEERLLPVPWCEDFSFHLNDIFTRLRIVNKEKTRGILNEEITNMTAIFKAQEGCQKPRTVLIEGDPGMGKTTYCQKLAYDWANRQEEWDESFPEVELLLLLRCHDIKSNIWEAIDEQILPDDLDEESKESFFEFVRENQSKVLLVLDGLDEVDLNKLDMYIKLVKSKELPKVQMVFTSRHEAGMKFRRFCDNVWEITGFTEKDAKSFIFKYFENMKHLAYKLLEQLFTRSGSRDLREMTSNPLNTALLCVLCEDFEGVFPASRTQLYIEIVLCVLRRYENKNELSSNSEDLIRVYEEELSRLGLMALKSLLKGELYIEESECGRNSAALTKFGFLSIQPGGTKRKPCRRYGFLHKSFQEFFAGFYLASQILSGEIDFDSLVTDKRYLNELNQLFLFMSGILALRCGEAAECLVKCITTHINRLRRSSNNASIVHSYIMFTFDCITECVTCTENLQPRLLRTFGSHLDFKTFYLQTDEWKSQYITFFFEALTFNTTIASLKLRPFEIGDHCACSLLKALKHNTLSLTELDLAEEKIGDFGATSLFEALTVNTTLTSLKLRRNDIGDSGAGSLSKVLEVNTVLTCCDLSWNGIGDSGACSLSKALGVNTALTTLDLAENKIGDSGATSLFEALADNTTLTHLNLSANKIADSGVCSLSKTLKVNTTLTDLVLAYNIISDCGAGSLSEGLAVNTSLTNLDLLWNNISGSGAASLSEALTLNTTLTHLDLSLNRIGDSGADSLSKALSVNTTLTHLDLRGTKIGNGGAGSLSEALRGNATLINLDLLWNRIGDSGAGSLAHALTVNTTLTHLNLSWNKIRDSGADSLSKALTLNTTLTKLNLSSNRIGDSGAGCN